MAGGPRARDSPPAALWLSGYVSVASLTVAALFPVWVGLTRPGEPYTFWAGVLLALLIVYSHRANIRRLRQGTENRFRTRKGVAAGDARVNLRLGTCPETGS